MKISKAQELALKEATIFMIYNLLRTDYENGCKDIIDETLSPRIAALRKAYKLIPQGQ